MTEPSETPTLHPSLAMTQTDGGGDLPLTLRLDRGAELGRYVILGPLGAGGMGVVYAAYDPQLDRKVAIKVLHRDGHGTEGRARLLREAKVLAQLSHPNVVTVHEAGTVDSRVYLVMEYVEGQTLTAWLAAGPRTHEEILEVFFAAGEGLAAAHAKELVHRDFKPDNVMVEVSGRVRVMDFGLARLQNAMAPPESTDPVARPPVLRGHEARTSSETAASGRANTEDERSVPPSARTSGELSVKLTRRSTLMGTPAYMAPEQWLGQDVDARTDQFSFCVSLYEALYGQRPNAVVVPGALMVAVTKGDVDPAPPGSRVPSWLRKVLLRGLSLEPSARYPDMAALVDALRADPTVARRRRIVVAGVIAAVLGVVVVQRVSQARHDADCRAQGESIAATWDDEARQRLQTALGDEVLGRSTWERVSPRMQQYADEWSMARTELCMSPPAELVADPSLVERAHACFEQRRNAMAGLIDAIAKGGDVAVERAAKAVTQLPRLQPCSDPSWLRHRRAEPEDPQVRERLEQLRAELGRVTAQISIAPGEANVAAARELLDRGEQLGWPTFIVRAHLALARAQQADARMEGSRRSFEQAYLRAAALDDLDLMLDAANGLAYVVGMSLGNVEGGELWSSLADVAIGRLGIGDDDLRTAARAHTQASVAFARADFDAVLALGERSLRIEEALLGPDHPSLVENLGMIANAYSALDDGAKAGEVLERVVAIEERTLGPDHPELGWTLMHLALARGVEQRYDESHEFARRALEIRERVYGPGHRFVGQSLDFMCAADADRGRFDRAQQECARALEILEREAGPEHPETAWCHFNNALLAQLRGDIQLARVHYGRALEIFEKVLGPENPKTMVTRESLAALDDPDGLEGLLHHDGPGHGDDLGHGGPLGHGDDLGHGEPAPH